MITTRIVRVGETCVRNACELFPAKKKTPPVRAGFSSSVFAAFRLTLSGGFLLCERLSQTIHRFAVIDAFDRSELTGHAV